MKNKKYFRKTVYRLQFLKKKDLFATLLLGFIFFESGLHAQQYDYADLLGKSLFFFEANACGPKPSTSTVAWRSNCHMNDGGGALIGGFHDAGDHVKFNYPMALPIYSLALSYLDYKTQYQATGNEQRILGLLRHAGQYMIRCHTAPNEYVIQVGLGRTDHQFWQSPEENTYFRDVLKINNSKPGSDIAGPTAGAMAAISEVFKTIDPGFSNNLLTHARQLFNFADTKRGPFSNHIPANERPFYASQNGAVNQIDDLMIGAVWLYRRTGEQNFKNKADQFFEQTKYRATGYAPSFGDHQYQAHMIMSQVTGDAKYINGSVRGHINSVLQRHFTPGGLWIWRAGHNEFNTYQTVGNAYLAYALAEFVGPGDSNYQSYKDFAIKQVEYLSGKNPRNSSYIGGFGPNFPKRIHHRAANNDTTLKAGAPNDQYVLNGALVSGPDSNDNYSNDRTNHRQTEPTLAPNSLLTLLAAQMVKEYNLGGGNSDTTNSNIIKNKSFTNNADNWQLWTSANAAATLNTNSNNGDIAITRPGAAPYEIQLRQKVALRRGHYVLHFRGKADANRNISMRVIKASPNYKTYFNKDISLTPNSRFIGRYLWYSQDTTNDRFLQFNLGGNSTNTRIDDVAMIKYNNQLINSNFSANLSNWSIFADNNNASGVSLTRENNKGRVTIANGGSQGYHVQFYNRTSLKKGVTYAFTFEVSAPQNKEFTAKLQLHASPYTSLVESTITATTKPRYHTLWFTADKDYPDIRVQFNLGGNNGDIIFDNVVLLKPEHITANLNRVINDNPQKVDKDLDTDFKIYPNPATDILFINSDKSISNVKILDISGKQVVIHNSLGKTNTEQIDISKLSSGLYFLKIKDVEGNILQKKIRIQN